MLLRPIFSAAAIMVSCNGAPQGSTAAAALPATADNPAQTNDHTLRTGAVVLRTILVEAGQIDGRRITDFQLIGRCRTAISAGRETTLIDWAKVGNFAARPSRANHHRYRRWRRAARHLRPQWQSSRAAWQRRSARRWRSIADCRCLCQVNIPIASMRLCLRALYQ
jgi:hypothetical protein